MSQTGEPAQLLRHHRSHRQPRSPVPEPRLQSRSRNPTERCKVSGLYCFAPTREPMQYCVSCDISVNGRQCNTMQYRKRPPIDSTRTGCSHGSSSSHCTQTQRPKVPRLWRPFTRNSYQVIEQVLTVQYAGKQASKSPGDESTTTAMYFK
jgi:hypothetical protein